jgi:DNA polymerase-3 subunit delta
VSQAVHVFLGEPFLREQAIKEKIQSLEAKESLGKFAFEGAKLDVAQLQEAVFAPSLFEPGRWVLIRQAHEFPDAEALLKLLEKQLPPSVYVLLDFEKLDKRSALYKWLKSNAELAEFAALDRRTLPGKIKDLLSQRKVKLSAEAFQYLSTTVQPDLMQLQNEIHKLSLFPSKEPLTLEEVQGLMFGGQQANVFQFFDTLGARNPRALGQFKQLRESGEEASKLYFMLASHIRSLLMLKSLQDQGLSQAEVAKQSGLAPWMVTRRLPQTQKWTQAALVDAVHRLHNDDAAIKTGRNDAESALLELILTWVGRQS